MQARCHGWAMRATLPLAALATLAALALLAPVAAAGDSPWDGFHQSWNAMADEMRDTPRDAQDTTVHAEEHGAEWCMWGVEESQNGADNAREQATRPPF
jgi:hypothetical protein